MHLYFFTIFLFVFDTNDDIFMIFYKTLSCSLNDSDTAYKKQFHQINRQFNYFGSFVACFLRPATNRP